MAHDETAWWMDAASRDLEMAHTLHASGLHEGAAFHAQQAGEKALKALLCKHGIEIRSHSANALLAEVERLGMDVSPVATEARDLDRNYIGARYPNGFGGPPRTFYDATIAGRAIEQAERVLKFCRDHLA